METRGNPLIVSGATRLRGAWSALNRHAGGEFAADLALASTTLIQQF